MILSTSSRFILASTFLALVWPLSSTGQAPAGATTTDPALKYCADHPTDSTRCLPPIPAGKDPRFPNGTPALPKPASPNDTIPGNDHLVDKATNPCPGCVNSDVTKPTAALDTKPQSTAVPPPVQNLIQIPNANQSGTNLQPGSEQPPSVTPPQTNDQQQRREDYEAGYAAGEVIGSAINGVVEDHRIDSYCKKNPTGVAIDSRGVAINCPQHPFDSVEQSWIDDYCRENPGGWTGVGKHWVQCLTPPPNPNLKWVRFEMKAWEEIYRHRTAATGNLTGEQIKQDWDSWRSIYCKMALPGATYKDLDGRKRACR